MTQYQKGELKGIRQGKIVIENMIQNEIWDLEDDDTVTVKKLKEWLEKYCK